MVATVRRRPFWVWLQLPWICKFEACMIVLSSASAVEEASTIISAFPHPAQGGHLKSIYHSTSITPSLCLRNGKKKEKHNTKWKKDSSFLRSSRISEKLNIQNIPLKEKKNLPVKITFTTKDRNLPKTWWKWKEVVPGLKKIPDSIYLGCTVKIMHYMEQIARSVIFGREWGLLKQQ